MAEPTPPRTPPMVIPSTMLPMPPEEGHPLHQETRTALSVWLTARMKTNTGNDKINDKFSHSSSDTLLQDSFQIPQGVQL